MSGVNKFKVGDIVKCVDDSALVNLTTGKEYVVVKTYDDDDMVMIDNDNGERFYYYSYRFELSNSDETSQPPKFKVGDVVKCVDNKGFAVRLTIGKEYEVVKISDNDMIMVDNGERFYYFSYRFELSEGGTTTSSRTQHQPPKFKEGDMVYLIGFDCLKSHKLLSTGDNYLTMKFRVVIDDDNSKTFTKNGYYTTNDATPRIVLATEENRQMLNKLLGVEYEPVKLTGSDLTKKLLKDNPQTCYVSDVSDDYASSNKRKRKRTGLILKFENGAFITMSDVHWKYAVPCNQHGRILEDE